MFGSIIKTLAPVNHPGRLILTIKIAGKLRLLST
jgi:hypothetical protein